MSKPSQLAVDMADAIKRILAADEGALAERIERWLGGGGGPRDMVVCGRTLAALMGDLS